MSRFTKMANRLGRIHSWLAIRLRLRLWLLRDLGMPMVIGRTNQRHNRQAAQERPLLGNGDDVAACRQEAEGSMAMRASEVLPSGGRRAG